MIDAEIKAAHKFAVRLGKEVATETRADCSFEHCPLERVDITWVSRPIDQGGVAMKAYRHCSDFCPVDGIQEGGIFERAIERTMGALGLIPQANEGVDPTDGTT